MRLTKAIRNKIEQVGDRFAGVIKKALGLALLGTALALPRLADAQLVSPRCMTLLSAQSLTNGGTYTFNVKTNFLQAMVRTHTARLVLVATPASSGTNGNFVTNAVLKFNWVHNLAGTTNTTSDTPFIWTVATNQWGYPNTTPPWTNNLCVSTNLLDSTIDSVDGIQFVSWTGSSTNAWGATVSLYLVETP